MMGTATEPGWIAYGALLLWVPLSIAAVLLMRPERAALPIVFGALLFLPEGATFKIANVPPLGKWNIPYLCLWLGCLPRYPRRVLRPPRETWVTALFVAIIAGGIGTALTNPDVLQYGPTRLPGLTLNDGLASAASWVLAAALPFYLGAALVQSSKDLTRLLVFLAAAGLVYSLFALFEIRMSPQLHYWVYGYEQHSFLQTLRWGGYRPMVFMEHGLAVALFFVVAAVSAAALVRVKRGVLGVPPKIATGLLAAVLVLCKSAGAVLYGLFALPSALLARPRALVRLAAVLAALVLAYPVMRGADLVPTERIAHAAQVLGEDRVESLVYRLHNEGPVLEKWRERPWFGWGEYGRSSSYNEEGETGSVLDGMWIITFATRGAVGFVYVFGLLLLPVLLTARRMRDVPNPEDRILLACLATAVALTGADLIPNGMFSNYPFFLSGALLTLSRTLQQPTMGITAAS